MADYHDRFMRSLQRNPRELARKIANRAAASLVRYVPADARTETPVGLAVERCLYPLPLVAFFAAMWIRGRNRRLLLTLAFLCAAYLAPYMIVAFYVRYLLPMFPVLALVLFLAVDQIAARFAPRAA